MAKHSKYDNIKHRKAAQDKIKGKIYSLYAKLITLAAQNEGDPEKNPNLAMVIEKAKKAGVPNDNIDRSIKKGTGEDKDGVQISEILYEGYAPGGVAVMVNVLTDNKNRTVAAIRHIFSKFSGNMGESGSVSWMFKRHGVIIIDGGKNNYDKIEELTYETNAEDISMSGDVIKIITSPEDLNEVVKYFGDKGIEIEEYELEYIPDNSVEITEFDKALKFTKMIEEFDEDEDVQLVSTNEEISKELQNEVAEFIEKNTFRT